MKKYLVSILYKVLSIKNWLKGKVSRKAFMSSCSVGKNFTCKASAKCYNRTGRRESIRIGNDCDILGTIIAEGEGQIVIGDYTTIRSSTRVLAVNSIYIGHYVIISNNVTLYDNNNHPTDPGERIELCKRGFYDEIWSPIHSDHAPIHIDDNVWIGERATVLKGVSIGRGAIVAMGAMVTKDVPAYAVVAGNPARVVKYLPHPEQMDREGCGELE